MQKEVRSWNKTWNKKNSSKEKCIVAKSLKFYLFALFPLKNFWSHFLTNLVVIKEGTAVMLGLRGLSLTSDDSWLHLRRHLLAFSCCRSFAFLDCLHINFYRAQFQIYHKIVLDRYSSLPFFAVSKLATTLCVSLRWRCWARLCVTQVPQRLQESRIMAINRTANR